MTEEKKKMPKFFIDAFYHNRFKDNFFVIKAGGKIIEDEKSLDSLLCNIRELTMLGIKVVLVYGFGRAVDDKCAQRGIEVAKINGRRVTDEKTLSVIKDIVGGSLSMNIAASMTRNDLEGFAFASVPGHWMKVDKRSSKPVDYGLVGDVREVSARAIGRAFKTTNFIACACLASDEGGQILNINADTIATQIAVAMKAHKLIFMSDVDGVKVGGETAFLIMAEEIQKLIDDGVATGGMRVKLENCRSALEAGVKRIHLINGLRENALHKEIFESVGPGTMLLMESERKNYMNEVAAQKALAAAANQ